MPNIPNTNQGGMILHSVGDGQNSSRWVPAGVVLPYTYSVSGTLSVPSGSSGFLPPFFFPAPVGQSVALVSVQAMVRAGSITANIQQNGTTIAGLSAIVVGTTAANFTPTNVVIAADSDYFAVVIASVTGADGLSLSFYFQVAG